MSAINSKLWSNGWHTDPKAFAELTDPEKGTPSPPYGPPSSNDQSNTSVRRRAPQQYYKQGIRGTIVMWMTMWKAAQIRIHLSDSLEKVYRYALKNELEPERNPTTWTARSRRPLEAHNCGYFARFRCLLTGNTLSKEKGMDISRTATKSRRHVRHAPPWNCRDLHPLSFCLGHLASHQKADAQITASTTHKRPKGVL